MERIIVGVDGSESAGRALQWAMSRATSEDVIVIAHTWPIPVAVGIDMPSSVLLDFEAAGKRLVKNLVEEIGSEGGPKIETDVRSGHAGVRLTELSAEADLVVVGSRGFGAIKSTLMGSTSTYVVHHAKCPVAVIRPKEAAAKD